MDIKERGSIGGIQLQSGIFKGGDVFISYQLTASEGIIRKKAPPAPFVFAH